MIEINNKEECCGCHACFNICPKHTIAMVKDEFGFKYPHINKNNCINCNLCEKVCPVLQNKNIEKEISAYACINRNEEIRKKSSSGGMFFLIAEAILDLDGVVFGAKFNENFDVEHDYIEEKDEIMKFMGSKYVQSDINNTYKKAKDFLEEGRYVLFTGTPCQIEGLNLYLQKQYEKLYTQDIICHGVPSPKAWKFYKDYIMGKSKITYINFRNKEDGWNNYKTQINSNIKKYEMKHNKDLYMKAFLNNMTLRDSCYNCKFKKKNRNSDITLADFWGIENINKKYNDNKGTSLVILNSSKGLNLFEKIKSKTVYEKIDIEEALKYNTSMIQSAYKNLNREKFLQDLNEMRFDECIKKYLKRDKIITMIKNKLKNKFKNFIEKFKKI